MVDTMPPLFGAGARFVLVGAILLPILAIRERLGARPTGRERVGASAGRAPLGGPAVLRPSRAELLSCGLVGLMLPGANAVVSVAEQNVPSGLAALLIGSIPLWVVLLRRISGDRVGGRSIAAVLVGFVGVALLVRPQGGATIVGLLACVGAAVMWATGSFASPRISLPRDPLVTTAWQSLLGGLACLLAAALSGELGALHPSRWSVDSVLGLAYLVTFGSILAFTAYAWLLQNAPIAKVATYAYVNPVIAVFLGWLFVSEPVSATTLAGAGIIVASVALVVRAESSPK
jgi:drug/metabolite transporter (DMT)-like permease